MTKQSKSYQAKRADLDDILQQIQNPNCDVDQATKLYEQGVKLVAEMRSQLDEAKNKINQLSTDGEATN